MLSVTCLGGRQLVASLSGLPLSRLLSGLGLSCESLGSQVGRICLPQSKTHSQKMCLLLRGSLCYLCSQELVRRGARDCCPLQLCNLLAEGLVLRRGLLEQGSLHLSVRLSLLLRYSCDGCPLLGVDFFHRASLLLQLSLMA